MAGRHREGLPYPTEFRKVQVMIRWRCLYDGQATADESVGYITVIYIAADVFFFTRETGRSFCSMRLGLGLELKLQTTRTQITVHQALSLSTTVESLVDSISWSLRMNQSLN